MTPAEKDTRKMVMEIPTTAPALRPAALSIAPTINAMVIEI